tara:strand:- start:548 stop:862 length:315 start_codon:yes stop_codon:yes gene_type:complete
MYRLKTLIHNNWIVGITPTAFVLFIHENGSTSTIQIAEYFDIDVKTVTYHMSHLKRGGYVERDGMITVYGLAVSSRTGKLTKTTRNCATYKVTIEFLKYLGNES